MSTDPWVERIGFGNGEGHLSFNKMVTFSMLWAFIFCVVTRREPSWALLSFGVIVVGAGFGLKGYLGAIKQNTTAAMIQSNTEIRLDIADSIRAAKERRDPKAGYEESGSVQQAFHD